MTSGACCPRSPHLLPGQTFRVIGLPLPFSLPLLNGRNLVFWPECVVTDHIGSTAEVDKSLRGEEGGSLGSPGLYVLDDGVLDRLWLNPWFSSSPVTMGSPFRKGL